MEYISKELALWLKERGCEVETDMYWNTLIDRDLTGKVRENVPFLGLKKEGNHRWEMGSWSYENVPAYSWYDLLVTHAKEFWGERQPIIENQDEPWKGGVCLHCKIDWRYQPPRESGCNHVHHPEACDVCLARSRGWQDYTEKLLSLIQENPYQAEAYVREYSLFAKQDPK